MHRILLLLFLLFSHFTVHSQLLWEISGNRLPYPSYLYGTMHVSDERVFQFSDSVLVKFKQCDAFAGELKFEPNMMFQMMNHLFMTGDTTLKDLYTPEQYEFIKNEIGKKLGMIASFTDRMKPIFISVLLSDTDAVNSKRPPLDLYFQDLAKQDSMNTIGLETFDEQIAVFNKISIQNQADALYEDLNDLKEGKNNIDELIDIYTSQDLNEIYRLTNDTYDDNLKEIMLIQRNKNMATRIDKHIRTQKIFIGIGAAHLPGKMGVIQLLKKMGYKVKPII